MSWSTYAHSVCIIDRPSSQVDGDRAKWLYRGYLIGDFNGNIGGRWRDTLSPADMPGYEGSFAMSRRQ
jgi:hypothetical protein